MQGWGFDFVRIPIAYPCYLDFDRNKDIVPEQVYNINQKAVEQIDSLVTMAHKYGLHVSVFNLHRAPGYCINAGFTSLIICGKTKAQKAFYFHWKHVGKTL